MSDSFDVTTPAPREAWETLLRNCPQHSIFTTPRWMDCVTEVEGKRDASRFYEFSNGKQAIFPLVESGWKSFSNLASMPQGWGNGGLVAQPGLDVCEMEMIINDLRSLGFMQIRILPNPMEDTRWKHLGNIFDYGTEHSTHVLDISKGFEYYWLKVLNSSTRNKIHKGEKSGLVVECDTTGHGIEDFYRIYLKWTENRARERKFPVFLSRWLAMRREPLMKFRVVCRCFGSDCQVWTAKLDHTPVASAILLIHESHAYYWRSTSDKPLVGPTRANELLQKSMIEEACRQGCQDYDMGESSGVRSLIHYKEKFGAVQHSCSEYYMENFRISKIQQSTQWFINQIEKRYVSKERESIYGA